MSTFKQTVVECEHLKKWRETLHENDKDKSRTHHVAALKNTVIDLEYLRNVKKISDELTEKAAQVQQMVSGVVEEVVEKESNEESKISEKQTKLIKKIQVRKDVLDEVKRHPGN